MQATYARRREDTRSGAGLFMGCPFDFAATTGGPGRTRGTGSLGSRALERGRRRRTAPARTQLARLHGALVGTGKPLCRVYKGRAALAGARTGPPKGRAACFR